MIAFLSAGLFGSTLRLSEFAIIEIQLSSPTPELILATIGGSVD